MRTVSLAVLFILLPMLKFMLIGRQISFADCMLFSKKYFQIYIYIAYDEKKERRDIEGAITTEQILT